MPFYEYQCKQCGHHLEAMQKINDAPLKKCPDCGKQALQRLMSAPVFRLKGSGWYETDFKSDDEGKRNLADRPEETAAAVDKKDGKEAAAKEAPGKDGVAKDVAPKQEKPAAPETAAKSADKTTAARPVAGKPTRAAKPVKAAKRAPAGRSAKKPGKRAARR